MQMVTKAWYSEVRLPQVFQAIERLSSKMGLRKLQHDNAPAHTARKTKKFLKRLIYGIQMIHTVQILPHVTSGCFQLERDLKGKGIE